MTTETSTAPVAETSDVETLARLIVSRQDAIAALELEVTAMKERLAKLLPKGDHEAGPYTVKVVTTRNLDGKAVAKDYPVAQNPLLYKASIDTAAARVMLEKTGVLDKYLVESKPSVRVA